uniref:Uncharacterized protein n=1 Tax=Prorocentrum micans TaxID=2945 RepID=A0A7S2X554_PROMC
MPTLRNMHAHTNARTHAVNYSFSKLGTSNVRAHHCTSRVALMPRRRHQHQKSCCCCLRPRNRPHRHHQHQGRQGTRRRLHRQAARMDTCELDDALAAQASRRRRRRNRRSPKSSLRTRAASGRCNTFWTSFCSCAHCPQFPASRSHGAPVWAAAQDGARVVPEPLWRSLLW